MEPIDLLIAGLRAAGTIALLFVLPGLALGPIVAPGAASPLGRLGRAVGVSLLTASATCTLLAVAGVLRPTIVVAVLVAATVLPLRPSRLPSRLPRGRARRWWLGAGVAVLLVGAVVVVPSQRAVGESLLPYTSTVWYYAGLSDRMATDAALPPTFPEWGTERPFQTDYLPFTAHAAAAFQLLPGDLLAKLEAYRLAVLGATTLLAALLFRRLVSSWLAVLGAVLLLATDRLVAKFLSFKPETFAVALALVALWAFDRALVERSRRSAGLAVAAAAMTFLSHAEVFLVLAAAAAGIAVARLAIAPGRAARVTAGEWIGRPVLGWRLPGPRRLGRMGGLVVGLILGGAVLGTLVNGALVGELRLLGYLLGDATAQPAPPAPAAADIPPGWTFTGDPTWDFYVAAVAPAQLGLDPPRAFTDARFLPRAVLHVWPGLDGRNPSLLIVLAALLAAPVVGWPWLDRRRRMLYAGAVVTGVALAAGAVLLFALADTYVPQRVGPRRIVPYELLVPVAAALVVLWGLDRLLRPAWRALLLARPDGTEPEGGPSRRRRAAARIAAGTVATALTIAMVAPAPSEAEDDAEAGGRLTPAGLEAWRWIAAETPPDARILTNAYTDGVVAALGQRTGIVDGRAVYLEDRAFLAESTALLLGARTLFLDPDGAAAARYLERGAVDLLLVATDPTTPLDLGGYTLFETDLAALEESARYTLERSFGGGRLRLYAVARTGS